MAKRASVTDIFPYNDADEPLPHGGDLAAARLLFPDAPKPFIDLSTGINPNPYLLPPLPVELFARLPDATATAGLAVAAATSYGAPSAAHVVPAPGTQILLPLVAGLGRPGRAAILSPTYNEHARAGCPGACGLSRRGWCGRPVPQFYRRPTTSTRARRALPAIASSRRASPPRWAMPISSSSPTTTALMAGSSNGKPCSLLPQSCGPAAASWWSTRRSWMSGHPAIASPAMWAAAISLCCVRSASFLDLPEYGSVSRCSTDHPRSGLRQCSDHGRCPGRPWPSVRR